MTRRRLIILLLLYMLLLLIAPLPDNLGFIRPDPLADLVVNY